MAWTPTNAAPYQLWIDGPALSSVARSVATVTVTTVSAHGFSTGDSVHVEGLTGSIGTAVNGCYQITVTGSTTFTYTVSGSATGSATITTGAISRDLFNPLLNYAGSFSSGRITALYVPLESVSMSAAGDGQGTNFGMRVVQDDTPSDGPWYLLIPDDARVRYIKSTTGADPASDKSDVQFLGVVASTSSELTDSGQGTITSVNVDDVNTLLDRLIVSGTSVSETTTLAAGGGLVRTSNVVKVTTDSDHGYYVGMGFTISGANGGAGTSFNVTSTVATVPDSTSFTFAQTGANATGDNWQSMSAVVHYSTSANQIQLTFSATHGINSGDTVTLRNVTQTGGGGTLVDTYVNTTFSGTAVVKVNTTQLRLTLAKDKIITWYPLSGGQMRGGVDPFGATVTPASGSGKTVIGIDGDTSEVVAVKAQLSVVAKTKKTDYAVQRLLSTSDVSLISGGSSTNSIGFTFPIGTLRACLDNLVEAFSGQDGKQRRYYINNQGVLNYALADSTTAPTYATAPYKLITTGVANYDTSTAAATVYPNSMSAAWDHHTTKNVSVTTAASGGSTQTGMVLYTSANFTARPGAPILDDRVESPTTSATANVKSVKRIGTAFLVERFKPILTVTFTLRGGGTTSWNRIGWGSGYYQTGAATFALQSKWAPGQWVSVTCAELGLSGLYRVEQVDFKFEPGSFTGLWTITANRRSSTGLVQQILKGSRK